ncbi:uncharacterized protein LOC130621297 [Hydractinia symbiolongicarpus]|uniref:uncharacterized protein LOC130621297 n=1 Tax=Hydractinia symbiolongicarpus TaxID=13093 RepID=UPI00254F75E1|nr:uncharacterized protein LOC130621297 [Hydractinia symbiolongicarpus]
MLSVREMVRWKKKRAATYVVFLCLYFLIGLELGCINATLWIYVSTVLKPKNVKMWYGLINAAFYVPSLFVPPIVSRFVDKTRRVKVCLVSIMFLCIAGSCLYPIHISHLFPLLGRFLSGFSIALTPVIVSEVARSYTKSEVKQRLPLLYGSRMVGYGVGPCISAFLIKVDFWIGLIHITYANVIGPILCGICVTITLTIIFFCHDLSREYDMKAAIMSKEEQRGHELSSSESALGAFKKILKTTDTLLVVVLSVFFGILEQMIFRVLPILIIENLHFGYGFLNGSLVGFAVLNTAVIVFLVYWKLSDKQVYYTGIASLLSIIVITSFLFLLYHKLGNVITWYVLIIASLISSILFLLSDQTFAVVVCAKLAFSCNQAFMEAVRIISTQSGRVIGGAFIGIYYDYMNVFYPVINMISILFLFALISRKKTLSQPVPVI